MSLVWGDDEEEEAGEWVPDPENPGYEIFIPDEEDDDEEDEESEDDEPEMFV